MLGLEHEVREGLRVNPLIPYTYHCPQLPRALVTWLGAHALHVTTHEGCRLFNLVEKRKQPRLKPGRKLD